MGQVVPLRAGVPALWLSKGNLLTAASSRHPVASQHQGQGRTARLSQEFCEWKIISSERSQPIGGLSPNWRRWGSLEETLSRNLEIWGYIRKFSGVWMWAWMGWGEVRMRVGCGGVWCGWDGGWVPLVKQCPLIFNFVKTLLWFLSLGQNVVWS